MNRFFLSIIVLACAACATTSPSWAADKSTAYCQGLHAVNIGIQKGDLSAKGEHRQFQLANDPPFSETDASNDVADSDLPTQWSHLSELKGPLQLLCFTDARMTQAGDAIPLPAGIKSCTVGKDTKGQVTVTCISHQS